MPALHKFHSLSLPEWVEFFKLDPWYVYGWCACDNERSACSCSDTWQEFETFKGKVSREGVSKAIADAENMLMRWLGFAPAPRWFEHQHVKFEAGEWLRKGGAPKTGILKHGFVQQFGVLTETEVGEFNITPSAPVYRHHNFVVENVILPAGTTADQIAVYVPLAERFNEGRAKWRLEPIVVTSLVDDVATIEIPAYLLALPSLTHVEPSVCLDRDNLDNYLTAVEVCVQSVDICDQGYARGLKSPCTRPPCQSQTQTVCFAISKSEEASVVIPTPAECDEDGVMNTVRCPTMEVRELYANYQAGYPLENGSMAEIMQTAVAYLSAALLTCDMPSCECGSCPYDTVVDLRKPPKEKTDEGQVGMVGDRYTLMAEKMGVRVFPWGSAAGALKAYLEVKDLRSLP